MENLKNETLTTEVSRPKIYDLEDRTKAFAKEVRFFVKKLNHSIGNNEDAKQLIRSSGSVGANYIEANESLSKKDFAHRIKICRKEAKETAYWLELIDTFESSEIETNRLLLKKEATELMKFFGAILVKTQTPV